MSVKVNAAGYNNTPIWTGARSGTHVLCRSFTLSVDLTMQDGSERILDAYFMCGFRCDGLSVPWLFRWFLKSWDDKNHLYNLAGAFHDWLYATGGANGMFTREECDDIFRGLLRESGKGRGKAGVADKAVEIFAGGSEHWKNDGYGIAEQVVLKVRTR